MVNNGLIKAIVALTVVGGGLVYFGLQAVRSSGSRSGAARETVTTLQATRVRQALSVTGRVKQDSLRYDESLGCYTLTLLGGESELPVQYRGEVPPDVGDRQAVILEGWLDARGVFQAQTMVAASAPLSP